MTTIELPMWRFKHPDPDIMAWLEANDIDPADALADQTLEIDEAGELLSVTMFLRDVHGQKMRVLNESGDWTADTERVTVPLKVHPSLCAVFDRVLS